MESWKIQRDRSKCPEPGCTLAADREYFAVLELPECVRRDLCSTCFHKLERGDEARAPVFWKCRRSSEPHAGPVLDLTALRMLFDRLATMEDERARGLRYFVALLLLRKRVLKMVDAQTPEQEQADLVVVDPKVPGMAPVSLVAPDLDPERLENLESELLEVMSSGDDDEVEAESTAG
ncbi:MAG: hypothetical protein KDB80_17255 [Planctomycetes bacterium]|nr:hypothetical protein [Planctomycetota bacterium]